MPWGLILVCLIVFLLFLPIHGLSKTSRPCPKGCHGCGRCMQSGRTPKGLRGVSDTPTEAPASTPP